MSAPFLTKDKDGFRLSFPMSLYPAQALAELRELYADQDLEVSEKGRYFELRLSAVSEQDCLEVAENFLRLAKNAKRS